MRGISSSDEEHSREVGVVVVTRVQDYHECKEFEISIGQKSTVKHSNLKMHRFFCIHNASNCHHNWWIQMKCHAKRIFKYIRARCGKHEIHQKVINCRSNDQVEVQ